ncbi:protein of unknown function [Xenorhabdus bovienii]|uniref:Uncharacterized protein n=1 Tax=Xenorhabdus bovienii TaxID=40576 RepID=A0A0B6XEC2_XENBV|nr:hypothetical protein XBFFR1_2370027 [Xenorhabdus bovienii str. feltiae France]CDM90619.1 protein of unknown function [Xenorhabdus bovienii]
MQFLLSLHLMVVLDVQLIDKQKLTLVRHQDFHLLPQIAVCFLEL